jgi:uncharacterized protein
MQPHRTLPITHYQSMTKYIMWGKYCDDVLEKRQPHRQAHLDNLAAQKAAGFLMTLGPTADVTM